VPIVAPELPSAAMEAIRGGVDASGRFPQRRGGALSLTVPHQVFTAGLEELAGGQDLAQAVRLTGWRALLEEDRQVVAAAEVPASNCEPAGASINRGAVVQSTVEALETAERHDPVVSEAFEPRLLRIPALYVTALWLHRAGAGDDLVIPLAPTPPPLTAGEIYDGPRFAAQVADMARSVASAYQAAERPGELGS
jgi:hypothetical protein